MSSRWSRTAQFVPQRQGNRSNLYRFWSRSEDKHDPGTMAFRNWHVGRSSYRYGAAALTGSPLIGYRGPTFLIGQVVSGRYYPTCLGPCAMSGNHVFHCNRRRKKPDDRVEGEERRMLNGLNGRHPLQATDCDGGGSGAMPKPSKYQDRTLVGVNSSRRKAKTTHDATLIRPTGRNAVGKRRYMARSSREYHGWRARHECGEGGASTRNALASSGSVGG